MAGRALVTGAGRGLGRYLTVELLGAGWDVTAVVRPGGASGPDGAEIVEVDLGAPPSIPAVTERVRDGFDLVVQCAVAYPPDTDDDPAWGDLEQVFRVNTVAPYLLTTSLLRAQPDDRFCAHVVVNSEAIYAADEHSAVYAATKAALRVLTTGLAGGCREANAAVSTLLLGPLADENKLVQAQRIAERKGLTRDEVVRLFLRRSNPNLVIEQFVEYADCLRSVHYLAGLGRAANGMLCKLDGGSSGSLI